MQQLTGMDAAFLAVDSPAAYGHVTLNFGALADRDLVPDVDLLVDALCDELEALSHACGAS